jgi:hypothetical protein
MKLGTLFYMSGHLENKHIHIAEVVRF